MRQQHIEKDSPWQALDGKLPRRYLPELQSGRDGLVLLKDFVQESSDKFDANNPRKILRTHRGDIRLPGFFPVTTFDYRKFPLDRVLQPYFKRLVDGVMVSYHYAKLLKVPFELPTFVDSGGFASLFKGTKIVDRREYFALELSNGDTITPQKVLDLQFKFADIAATLDCIIPPKLEITEARRRQKITLKNALFTLKLWQDRDEPRPLLIASVQAWDEVSAKKIVEKLKKYPFHGYALGGMVPRASKPESIVNIVDAIREVDPNRFLHVFGIGTPRIVKMLFEHGVDSVDSSAFIQHGVSSRMLNPYTGNFEELKETESVIRNKEYTKKLSNTGVIANMGKVLKNLKDSFEYLKLYPFSEPYYAGEKTVLHSN